MADVPMRPVFQVPRGLSGSIVLLVAFGVLWAPSSMQGTESQPTIHVSSQVRLAASEGKSACPMWNFDDRHLTLATQFEPSDSRGIVQLQFCKVSRNGGVNPNRDWYYQFPPGYTPGMRITPGAIRIAKFVIDEMCWLAGDQHLYSANTNKRFTECPGDSCGGNDIYKSAIKEPSYYSPLNESQPVSSRKTPLAAYLRTGASGLDPCIVIVDVNTGRSTPLNWSKDKEREVVDIALHPEGRFLAWSGREYTWMDLSEDDRDAGQKIQVAQNFDVFAIAIDYDPATGTPKISSASSFSRSSDIPQLRMSDETSVAWDPAGRPRLACYRKHATSDQMREQLDLVVLDLDEGGRFRQWWTAAPDIRVEASDLGPAWDPTGQRIYYFDGDLLEAVDLPWTDGHTAVGTTYLVDVKDEKISYMDVAVSPDNRFLALTGIPTDYARSLFLLKIR